MVNYIKPLISHVEADFGLLAASGPTAGDIGSPSVRNNSKSIWDEVENTYNINKEEQEDENWK